MPRVYERNGWWYLDVRVAGKRHRLALKTRNRREAEKRAREALSEAASGPPIVGSIGLGDALDDLIKTKRNPNTRAAYRWPRRALTKVLGEGFDVGTLERATIDAYLETRREIGISEHTLQKEMTLLRQSYRHAFPAGVFPYGTFDAQYEPRKRFLTLSEAGRLLAVATPRGKVWLMLALYSGAEPAAIPRTDWNQIDFDLGSIHVRGTKGKTRDRRVPLAQQLRTFLGGLSATEPLVPDWPARYRDMRRWCERLEIEHATLTDCRRTFGSWLKQAGVDSKRIADLMGHTSTKMADEVYGQLNAESYRDAIDQLPALPRLVTV